MRIIVDLTAHANLTTAYLGRGAPFITQETFDAKRLPSVPVTFAVLKKVYRQHTAALEHGTASVSSDDVSLNDLKQLFSLHDVPAAAHIIWFANFLFLHFYTYNLIKFYFFIYRFREVEEVNGALSFHFKFN